MKRRDFLESAGVAAAASTIAQPALAQSTPELRWRMATSWLSRSTYFTAPASNSQNMWPRRPTISFRFSVRRRRNRLPRRFYQWLGGV